MRDLIFYPVFILVVLGAIGLAMLPGERSHRPTSQNITLEGYVLAGEDMQRLTQAPGTLMTFETDSKGKVLYAVMSANLPKKLAPPSAGVFDVLNPPYEQAFAGRDLKITITARAGQQNPLEKFQTAYFSSDTTSGWQVFTLTPDFEDYVFTFTPPAKTGVLGAEYIGIWPGIEGRMKTVEIQNMKIEIIKP
ncbi:MAG: hypothetical protein COA69_10310 [Robiginitomaculum sp.]|nr:MAG: hypothetical protein COA69_10310 [Robiginitomaculum sp.]